MHLARLSTVATMHDYSAVHEYRCVQLPSHLTCSMISPQHDDHHLAQWWLMTRAVKEVKVVAVMIGEEG